MSEQTYTAVVLEDPEGHDDSHDGRLLEKLRMSSAHSNILVELGGQLANQLDRNRVWVQINSARVKRIDVTSFIQDVMIVATTTERKESFSPPRGGSIELAAIPGVWVNLDRLLA